MRRHPRTGPVIALDTGRDYPSARAMRAFERDSNMATTSRNNVYHVPAGTWEEWTVDAREIFNYLYSLMRANQNLFLHPKGVRNSRSCWNTTAWNAAYEAADCRTNMEKAQHDTKRRGARITDVH